MNWTLPAGTYWAAFEVRPGDDYVGFMSGSVPNPLEDYASDYDPINGASGAYVPSDSSKFGLRIFGDPVVPEPSSMLLLGSGLAGWAASRRRKKA